jgi:serine protease AprX
MTGRTGRTTLRRLVVGTASVALLVAAPGSAPAQASGGLLGDLVGGVVSLAGTTVTSLLGPTGWMYDDTATPVAEVASVIGADKLYARGITGRGVGVALVDTGVVQVKGFGSNIVNGPDLSFESQYDASRYLDTFGHGTHMAGIIAGSEPATLLGPAPFRGIAPGV